MGSRSFYFFVFLVCVIKILINIEAIEINLSQNPDTYGNLPKQAFDFYGFDSFPRLIQIK
jgi:hypothetical protein